MSTVTENQESCERLTQQMRDAVKAMEESAESDKDKWVAAKADTDRIAGELETIKEALDREQRVKETADAVANMNAFLAEQRTASKASLIGSPQEPANRDAELFFVNVAKASNSRNPWAQAEGKAALEAMGIGYAQPDPAAKATLGTTDAAGGYLVPNNQVADIERTKANVNIYRRLMTVISGVTGDAVDVPFTNAAS